MSSLPRPQRATSINNSYSAYGSQQMLSSAAHTYNKHAPSRLHQEIVFQLAKTIDKYIDKNKGSCKVCSAPFAVFLDSNDTKKYVEPDISVICDKSKLNHCGCIGVPDWIIEVVSPSSKKNDYHIKLFKYRTAGVREYRIVDPITNYVTVHYFQNSSFPKQYDFDDDIPVNIYKNFAINISQLLAT